MKWTEEKIRELIRTNDSMLYRSIIVLYNCQTDDEKRSEETRYRNGMGFNAFDAKIMTSFAEFLKKNRFLSEKQKRIARRIMAKYVKQVTKLANEEVK